MTRSPRLPAILAAYVGLFPGSAAVGVWLAELLAPGSRLAELVSFLALPIAFAAGLKLWFGLTLLGLVPRLLGRLRASGSAAPAARTWGRPELPGSWVFFPLSSVFGLLAGVAVGLASSSHAAWLVALVYWLVGSLHGLLAWRLARAGFLMPPDAA